MSLQRSVTNTRSYNISLLFQIDDIIIFLSRTSPVSPYLGFLHFDVQSIPQLHGITFEATRGAFQARDGAGERTDAVAPKVTMYALNISKVLGGNTAEWFREPVRDPPVSRPDERSLYTITLGRSEIFLFGGYFREHGGRRCRVSNDVYILKPAPKAH
jgi:hypothetical protein